MSGTWCFIGQLHCDRGLAQVLLTSFSLVFAFRLVGGLSLTGLDGGVNTRCALKTYESQFME